MSIEPASFFDKYPIPANIRAVSVDDHFSEANVHLVSSVQALNTFWDMQESERVKKIVYIPAASDRFSEFGFKDYFIDQERSWLVDQVNGGKLDAIQELTLRYASTREIQTAIGTSDGVFIGAGNTQYLLEILKSTSADKIIYERVANRSIMYLGRCAGAIVAGPDIAPRGTFWPSLSINKLDDTSGMKLTNVFPIPHIDSEPIMNRIHAENGHSGWRVAVEMALRHPTIYLTDRLSQSSAEDLV